MTTFDPFTSTLEEAQAQPDAYALRGPVLRWGAALEITAHRVRLEQHPIEGVARCVRAGLVAPDWLAAAFMRQYDMALNCRAGTWDEAFGPAQPRGVHLSTLRLRRLYRLRLQRMFDGPDRLPRTLAGRQEAARRLGITEKQVRTLLPMTRSNARGHKPYTAVAAPAFRANDPFSLAHGSTQTLRIWLRRSADESRRCEPIPQRTVRGGT